MKTVECQHEAKTKKGGGDVTISTCVKCGQEVIYPTNKLRTPVVKKIGRIGDRIVLPNPEFRLQLKPQDKKDLAAADEGPPEKEPAEPPAETPAVNPTERPSDPAARLKWYKKNKKAMIEDLLTLGKDGFLEKWPVPGQQISHLKSDPYYKKRAEELGLPTGPPRQKPAKPGAKADKPPKAMKVVPAVLPQLPPWNDNWDPKVQLRWLAIYEKKLALEAK